MENVLSQDEVDALLRGLTDGEIEGEPEDKPTDEEGVVIYNLASQDRIVRGRMPSLEIIGERFARLSQTSLSKMLSKIVDINFGSIKTTRFGEFMKTLPVPSSMHILRMKPLRGNLLFIMDTRIVFLLINCFFGGGAGAKSATKVEGRDFTAIENRIIKKVVDQMLIEWDIAWKPIYQINTQYIRSEINPQFASIVPPTDVVIQVTFDVEIEQLTGSISFCIPYSNIEPIRSKLHAGYQADQFEIDETWLKRLKGRLIETPVELIVELGKTMIVGKDLINLNIGDTIVLNQNTSDNLIAKIEGVPKFRTVCGINKGNIAAKITDDIEIQKY